VTERCLRRDADRKMWGDRLWKRYVMGYIVTERCEIRCSDFEVFKKWLYSNGFWCKKRIPKHFCKISFWIHPCVLKKFGFFMSKKKLKSLKRAQKSGNFFLFKYNFLGIKKSEIWCWFQICPNDLSKRGLQKKLFQKNWYFWLSPLKK